ncbi:hypothetical protein F5Y01DRAFT_78489 [Xylaria sp. FL0043]|nr:hypothetical protein F5Y01DRAFT_78489 [Xylaria sp. FL0043]
MSHSFLNSTQLEMTVSSCPCAGCAEPGFPRHQDFTHWSPFGGFEAPDASNSVWICSNCGKKVENEKECPECRKTEPQQRSWPFVNGAELQPELHSLDRNWQGPVVMSDWICTKCKVKVDSGESCPTCDGTQGINKQWLNTFGYNSQYS